MSLIRLLESKLFMYKKAIVNVRYLSRKAHIYNRQGVRIDFIIDLMSNTAIRM